MALPNSRGSYSLPTRQSDATVGIGNQYNQNPLLVPRTDPGLVTTKGNQNTGGASVPFQSPNLLISTDMDTFIAGGVGQVANARVEGVNTVVCGGTVTATDVTNLIFTSPLFPGGAYTLVVNNQAGDNSTGKMALRIDQVIDKDPVLHGLGIHANPDPATSTSLIIWWPGPIGLFVVLTSAIITGTQTATVGTPSWVGGSGPVIPWMNTNTTVNGQIYSMQVGQPTLLPLSTVGLMVSQGIPLT